MTPTADQWIETPSFTRRSGPVSRPSGGIAAHTDDERSSEDAKRTERNTMSVVYRTAAVSTGNGRNGRSRTTDGVLDLTLTTPKPGAGPGDPTNPEQLFASGYSACFHSAVKTLAKGAGIDVTDSSISVQVGLVKSDSGFSLQAAITGDLPGVDRDVAADLLARAHQRCPYSKAIAGNVDVTLTVGRHSTDTTAKETT